MNSLVCINNINLSAIKFVTVFSSFVIGILGGNKERRELYGTLCTLAYLILTIACEGHTCFISFTEENGRLREAK